MTVWVVWVEYDDGDSTVWGVYDSEDAAESAMLHGRSPSRIDERTVNQ